WRIALPSCSPQRDALSHSARPRESGDPDFSNRRDWIPACAGMSGERSDSVSLNRVPRGRSLAPNVAVSVLLRPLRLAGKSPSPTKNGEGENGQAVEKREGRRERRPSLSAAMMLPRRRPSVFRHDAEADHVDATLDIARERAGGIDVSDLVELDVLVIE